MEQASPFFSRAADASAAEVVPAKDAGMRVLNGMKTAELMDPISPAKLGSTDYDQLPPLLSMIIDGLPPLQQSKYVDEAEKRLQQYAERYPKAASLKPYCRVGLSTGSYLHPAVISVDRLVVISLNYTLMFLLDDLLFDTRDEFLQDQYDISRSACGSPEKTQEYLDHLDAVISQREQPRNLTPLIETLMWELGRDTLEMSNPEWFNRYVACVMEFYRASVESQRDILQGRKVWLQDLESYTIMRIGNSGVKFVQMLVEFAKDAYIPGALRANPYLENLTKATSIHLGFVNDIFSYHKESALEQNPRNLITMLMECEGKPFAQTVHTAIDLTNTHAHAIMDSEGEALNSTLQNHLQDIKALIAGNVYYSIMDYRYRHPDSCFPELRDMPSSWKILPHSVV